MRNFSIFNPPEMDSNMFLKRPLFKSMYSSIGSQNRRATAKIPPAAGSHHVECSLTSKICWSSNGINVVSSFIFCPIFVKWPKGKDCVSSFLKCSLTESPLLSEKFPGGGRLLKNMDWLLCKQEQNGYT